MKTRILALALITAGTFPLFAQDEKKAEEAPKKAAAAQKLTISAKPGGLMKFEETELKAKAGQPIELTFKNPDVLQHNLLIVKPGSKEKVGAAADAFITNPNAMAKGFIPESEDILHHTKLLNAGQSETIKFTLDTPGEYPIMCTFPGHWRLMLAVLKVEK